MNLTLAFRRWVPLAVGFTLVGVLVCTMGQQHFRQSANDPQVQIAEDAAAVLERGGAVQSVVPVGTVDIAHSLAPFVEITDNTGKPIVSSGRLDGQMPQVPVGVFAFARLKGEHRVTWQPRPYVRSALVIVRYEGKNPGFVVAGRSLREMESRVVMMTVRIAIAWVVIIIATFLAVLVPERKKGESRLLGEETP